MSKRTDDYVKQLENQIEALIEKGERQLDIETDRCYTLWAIAEILKMEEDNTVTIINHHCFHCGTYSQLPKAKNDMTRCVSVVNNFFADSGCTTLDIQNCLVESPTIDDKNVYDSKIYRSGKSRTFGDRIYPVLTVAILGTKFDLFFDREVDE